MVSKPFKKNKGILDKRRFVRLENERIQYLHDLSPEKSIRIMEQLLDSGIINEFRRIQKRLSHEGA